MSAKTTLLTILTLVSASLLVGPPTAVLAADDTAAQNKPTDDKELARIAGRYERTVRNEAGTEFRVVKEVAGDQSTVTTYDDVGQVVTFRNLKVTAGPEKGREQPAPQSYLYRLEGENFAETWGLLPEDKSPPRMIYWKKVK
jgi:hypothetical protein